MGQQTIITLDFNGCKSSFDMQTVIQKAFDFPDWYGKGWDAFWDLFYPTRENTVIRICGIASMPEKTKKHVDTLLRLLQENKEAMAELKQRKPEFDCRFDFEVID